MAHGVKFEIDWNKLSSEGHKVNVKAVFVEGDEEGTYSPFWCIRESKFIIISKYLKLRFYRNPNFIYKPYE